MPPTGVTVKLVDAAPALPDEGPVNVKVVAVAALGVTELLAADGEEVPVMLVAVTVNVYAWPLVRPVMECDREVEPALASVPPEGLEVTV